MSVRALVIVGITSIVSIIIPATAMSQTKTSSERIDLEVSAPQNTWENNNQVEERNNRNDQIEVNSEEISFQSNEWSGTFELEQTEDNCYTNQTNQSSDRKTFEGYCDWGWEF